MPQTPSYIRCPRGLRQNVENQVFWRDIWKKPSKAVFRKMLKIKAESPAPPES